MASEETSAASPKRADFTEGPILESILRMGLPSMFGFLIQHIYTLVDMYWVSNLPEAEASSYTAERVLYSASGLHLGGTEIPGASRPLEIAHRLAMIHFTIKYLLIQYCINSKSIYYPVVCPVSYPIKQC